MLIKRLVNKFFKPAERITLHSRRSDKNESVNLEGKRCRHAKYGYHSATNYINRYDILLNQRGYPISTMLVLTQAKLP